MRVVGKQLEKSKGLDRKTHTDPDFSQNDKNSPKRISSLSVFP
jgi:hypothetical protein